MVTTRLYALVCLAGVLAASSPAWAQFSVRFWEREYNDDERKDYTDGFNLEECLADMTMTFEYTYSGSLSEGDLYVYVGSGCDEKTNRDEGRCFAVIENQALQTSAYVEIHPAPVVEPTADIPGCTESEGASDVFFLVLAADASETVVYQQSVTLNYDTLPPDPPVDIGADWGEGMIRVSWDVSEPDFPEEWDNFVVVCFGGDHTPTVDASTDTSTADTATDTAVDSLADPAADVPADADPDVADDVVDDAPVDALPDTAPDTVADVPATDTTTITDTTGDGAAATCPEGGFETGDEYVSAWSCSGELGSTTRSYELGGLVNNTPYKVSVVAIDSFGNESDIAEIACATPSEVDDFWEEYKQDGGGDDGGFCFVATAAFGDYDHPAVRWLRAFRDEVLSDLPGGDAAVSGYYDASPPAARWLRAHPAARVLTRAALWPVAGAAAAAVEARRHPALALLLALGLVACVVAMRASGLLGGARRRG